jgi:hypothetical protein
MAYIRFFAGEFSDFRAETGAKVMNAGSQLVGSATGSGLPLTRGGSGSNN